MRRAWRKIVCIMEARATMALRDAAVSYNRMLQECGGGGDCMFRSINFGLHDQLGLSLRNHLDLRRDIVAELQRVHHVWPELQWAETADTANSLFRDTLASAAIPHAGSFEKWPRS